MFPKDYEEIEKVQIKVIKKLLYALVIVGIVIGAIALVYLIQMQSHRA